MELTPKEQLAAWAIGLEVVRYLRRTDTLEAITSRMDSLAVNALADIQRVVADDAIEDPECFSRIESILCTLEDTGMITNRHDW